MLTFKQQNYSSYQPAINAILKDDITGIVVENSINKEILDILKNSLTSLKQQFFTDLNDNNGFSLPGMFGQLHKTQPFAEVDNYFQNIKPFCAAVDIAAGFCVQDWIRQQLTVFFNPFRVAELPGFLPYSFRVVFPNRGGLFMHQDGKLLPFIHDIVSQKIELLIKAETMMSWYFTLQAPESGGELWVADSQYESYEKYGQFNMKSPTGKILSEDDLYHIKVKTTSGSFLMFKGGTYWHKVMPPNSTSVNRITLGGFMALGIDN
jgi:hypothetical protein